MKLVPLNQRLARWCTPLAVMLLVLAVAVNGCAQPSKLPKVSAHFESPQGASSPQFSLEVCSDDGQRALGLMYRKSMAEFSGMLFVFPDQAQRSFWMKNTYLSLDMLFIDRAKRVVGILENVPPLNESPRAVDAESSYVIELGAGIARKYGIEVGSTLVVSDSLPQAR